VRVSIGHDSRLSAPALKAAAARGLRSVGVAAADFGLASTPAMVRQGRVRVACGLCATHTRALACCVVQFMSTVLVGHQYEGAVMLTASHLPANRNGLKFFTAQGGLESDDIVAILQAAAEHEAVCVYLSLCLSLCPRRTHPLGLNAHMSWVGGAGGCRRHRRKRWQRTVQTCRGCRSWTRMRRTWSASSALPPAARACAPVPRHAAAMRAHRR
jgi:hypothetical protein